MLSITNTYMYLSLPPSLGNQCPKGKHCNFLHVFINPDGKFNWSEEDTK